MWYRPGMGKRGLVIHQGALGDVVLSFPALVAFQRQRDVRLTLLCARQIGRMAQDLGLVDCYYPTESRQATYLFQRHWRSEASRFFGDFDLIIFIGYSQTVVAGLQHNFGGPTYWVTPRPDITDACHVARHVVKGFEEQGLLFASREMPEMSGALNSHVFPKLSIPVVDFGRNGELFVLHVGSGSDRKRWNTESFVTVAREIQANGMGTAVFLIGPAEEGLITFLKKEIGRYGRPMVLDLDPSPGRAGQVDLDMAGPCFYLPTRDLREVISLLKRTRCFVGNDSGLTHLAAYLGVPTIALFGPSSPSRWAPVGNHVTLLRGAVDCRPCFETSSRNCEDPRCLTGISTEMVLEALEGGYSGSK